MTFYRNAVTSSNAIIVIALPFLVSTLVYNLSEATLFAHGHPNWIIFVLMLFMSTPAKYKRVRFFTRHYQGEEKVG